MMLTAVIWAEQKMCGYQVFAYIRLDCLGHTGYSTPNDFIKSFSTAVTFRFLARYSYYPECCELSLKEQFNIKEIHLFPSGEI